MSPHWPVWHVHVTFFFSLFVSCARDAMMFLSYPRRRHWRVPVWTYVTEPCTREEKLGNCIRTYARTVRTVAIPCRVPTTMIGWYKEHTHTVILHDRWTWRDGIWYCLPAAKLTKVRSLPPPGWEKYYVLQYYALQSISAWSILPRLSESVQI
jgi:hypothetical protein